MGLTTLPSSLVVPNVGTCDYVEPASQVALSKRVELPFTRSGGEANGSGAITIYEPDSADDLNDSDPDEDLEL